MYRYTDFSAYVRQMTGLTIYDFSVLTWGPFTEESNEAELKELLDEWLGFEPSELLKERARNDLAERGYVDMGV